MNTFLNEMENTSNETLTENGALTNASSKSALLDFFALAGATRKNPKLGVKLFKKALAEDNVKAIKLLFYFRDIRGGQGERELFRNCLEELNSNYKELYNKILPHIPEYGRWDDILGQLRNENVVELIRTQLAEDYKSEQPSLLAKWLPSENASSKKTVLLAKDLIKKLEATPKTYRKLLTELRNKIRIVENNLRTKDYLGIDYSKLPSQAGMKYTKAFYRNDEERYKGFIEEVKKGEKTINTETVYPYQIYNRVKSEGNVEALNVIWDNLPDYTQGNNAIVVADVSDSMSGDPVSVSVSLALYFAERNKGQFKDYFITFSSKPKLQKIQGNNLYEKMNALENAEWEQSTDLQKVFELILDSAKKANAPQEELPSTIYIISDMEFDEGTGKTYYHSRETNYQEIDRKYSEAGYKRPSLVFWNVDARNKQVPVTKYDNNVTLVSGLSPSTFRLVVENKSPLDLMNDIINSPRYSSLLD